MLPEYFTEQYAAVKEQSVLERDVISRPMAYERLR
jgi:hypothetical protein